MLDKNPEQIVDNNLVEIQNEFNNSNPNIVLYSEPFVKMEFLNNFMNYIDNNIIFLDFDLMYSGYIMSQMIPKNKKIKIFRPERKTLTEIIQEISEKISKEKFLVIIDSFNGINGLFDGKESPRLIHSIIMLLVSVGNNTGSSILITSLARKKEDKTWITSPGGRHIIDSKNSSLFLLKKINNSFVINPITNNRNSIQN